MVEVYKKYPVHFGPNLWSLSDRPAIIRELVGVRETSPFISSFPVSCSFSDWSSTVPGSDLYRTSGPVLPPAVDPPAYHPGVASLHEVAVAAQIGASAEAGAGVAATVIPPTGATAEVHLGTPSLGLAVGAAAAAMRRWTITAKVDIKFSEDSRGQQGHSCIALRSRTVEGWAICCIHLFCWIWICFEAWAEIFQSCSNHIVHWGSVVHSANGDHWRLNVLLFVFGNVLCPLASALTMAWDCLSQWLFSSVLQHKLQMYTPFTVVGRLILVSHIFKPSDFPLIVF